MRIDDLEAIDIDKTGRRNRVHSFDSTTPRTRRFEKGPRRGPPLLLEERGGRKQP